MRARLRVEVTASDGPPAALATGSGEALNVARNKFVDSLFHTRCHVPERVHADAQLLGGMPGPSTRLAIQIHNRAADAPGRGEGCSGGARRSQCDVHHRSRHLLALEPADLKKRARASRWIPVSPGYRIRCFQRAVRALQQQGHWLSPLVFLVKAGWAPRCARQGATSTPSLDSP